MAMNLNHSHYQRKIRPLAIKLSWSQAGLVSIIVTMVMMLVLSVTVVGFALLMRREQRQSLDRQLNSQALYAAEAGINDAAKAINDLLAAGSAVPAKKTCPPASPPSPYTMSSTVGASNVISYSCLLIDPAPEFLKYDNADGTAKVIPINGVDASGNPVAVNGLQISWEPKDGSTVSGCPPAGLNLPPAGSWSCNTGLLRVDLVPTPAPPASFGANGRDYLNANVRSFFLFPGGGGPSPNMAGPTGVKVGSSCAAGPAPQLQCKVTITGMGAANYYMRLMSLYKPAAVVIKPSGGVGGATALAGAQAVVDSTGKANDVLRRLQARISLSPLGPGPFPGAAIQSADTICKRLFVVPGAVPPVDTDVADAACGIN